ncbi:MAG TPA: DNA polymerase IV [Bacteroides sp.]|nr:DNA polymerase IV [Bacteroides sp.]
MLRFINLPKSSFNTTLLSQNNTEHKVRKIIHVDMDAFFASVEQRDFPDYRGKPLVVGGDSRRGVVAAASYEARKYGIHSAMPTLTALHRYPKLIIAKPRFDVYKQVSRQIMDIFRTYTDLVEPLSFDEAFLDVSNNKFNMPSATLIAREIKSKVKEETSLTASAGVSINKFLAKIASDMDKPDGLFVITPDKAESFIEELPVSKFFGVGKVTAARMQKLGIYEGKDLKGKSKAELLKLFGKNGSFFYNISRGIDNRPVNPERIRKSWGKERTFEEDLTTIEEVLEIIQKIAELVSRDLDKYGIKGRTITVKVKYSDFRQISRSKSFPEYINDENLILSTSKDIMTDVFKTGDRIRLLGITLSNLEQAAGISKDNDREQLSLDL